MKEETPDVVKLMKKPAENFVKVPDVLLAKIVLSRQECPEKTLKEILIAGLLVNTQSLVRMFWNRMGDVHLMIIAL